MTDETRGPAIELMTDQGGRVRFFAGGQTSSRADQSAASAASPADGKTSEVRGVRMVDLKSDGKKCANCQCGEAGSIKKLLRCSQCKAVYYCDVECQKFHWAMVHKAQCKKP